MPGSGASTDVSAPLTLLAMARAYRTSQLVYVAAKLGIADLLASGPKTCTDLAGALSASTDALCRVMRGLEVAGIFTRRPDGRYELTDLSRPLLTDHPRSVRSGIIYVGEEQFRAWGGLLQTVVTGAPAFRSLFGDPFDHYDRHPESAEVFDSWMARSSRSSAEGLSLFYAFPDTGQVVDVGGGEGVLLAAILQPRPELSGCLLERASVIEKAKVVLAAAGLLDRCTLVAGDFRTEVPAGGDVYVLKNVLHDWDDAGAVAILGACRKAMRLDSRLVVIQRTMPEDASNPGLLRSMVEADLMQLVYSGGRERTLGEYRALLSAVGLDMSLVMQSGGVTSLMEARPAGAAG